MADAAKLVILAGDDSLYVRLARDIAIEMHPIDELKARYGLTDDAWVDITTNLRFIDLLVAERTAWLAATNTHERVKLKAASMVEEWLPELYSRMHDPKEALNAKVEAGKLAARLAGMGLPTPSLEGVGDRIAININLGADNQIKLVRDVAPTPAVIEHEEY